MKQPGSHWTDFHEIWYLSIFRKSIEEIQVSLKSDNNNGCFTWRPIYIFYHISLNSSYNEKIFEQNLLKKSKYTFYVPQLFFFFFKISCGLLDNAEKYCRAWRAIVDDIIRRIRIACWITKDTATHSVCVILLPLLGNIGYANAPQCYDILRTLLVSPFFHTASTNYPTVGWCMSDLHTAFLIFAWPCIIV